MSELHETDVEMEDEMLARNRPEQDDTVVYLSKNGKAKLGVVTRVFRSAEEEGEKFDQKLRPGEVLIDVLPGSSSLIRKEDEVHVLDRGFTLSESVIRPDQPKKIGFIKNIHVKADAIVLPERKIIARGVDLRNAKFTEPFASGGQNYLLFDEWIGNARKSVYELTIVYRGCYRCRIKDNLSSSILYRRRDYGATRQWIPGETVMVSTSYILSKKVEWETEVPPYLRKRMLRSSHTMHTPFTIEKVSLYSVKVRWITTPSASVNPPPEKITKPDIERVIKLDTLEYTQAVCGDRMRMHPDDSVTVIRKAEWEKATCKELMAIVPKAAFAGMERRRKKSNNSSSSSSSSGSTRASSHQSSPVKKRADSSPSSGAQASADVAMRSCRSSESDSESGMLKVNPEPAAVGILEADTEEKLAAHQTEEKEIDECVITTTDKVLSEVKKADDDSVDQTHPAVKLAPVVPRFLASKKAKTSGFNVRQIRRNKLSRTLKRKAEPARLPLDMRSCLGEEFYGEILSTKSVVDVIWMDGTVECGISGTELVPYELDLDQHDHVPGAIVAKKITEVKESEFGIVLSADTEKRLAYVRWYKYNWNKPGSEPVLGDEEQCSLFELMLHPNYHRFWWGSLCLRTSVESADVRNLIGQLISSNENGKNTVCWFNGIVEEVWPVEITNLLTNEELDAPMDEEEEDDTWQSVDLEDLDIMDSTDANFPESGISVVLSESTKDREADIINARVFLPKELILAARKAVESQKTVISRYSSVKVPKKWHNTVKGQVVTLSGIYTIMEQLLSDYEKGDMEHDDCMSALRHLLKCITASVNVMRFSLDDFFFTCAVFRDKQTDVPGENIAKRHLQCCFKLAMDAVKAAGEGNDCTIPLDVSLSVTPSQFDKQAVVGITFLKALFDIVVNELFELFRNTSREDLPPSAEDFFESPFFSSLAVSSGGMPSFAELAEAINRPFALKLLPPIEVTPIQPDTAKEPSDGKADEKSSADEADEKQKPSDHIDEKQASAEGTPDMLTEQLSELRKAVGSASAVAKTVECMLATESLRAAEYLMPSLSEDPDVVDRGSIKKALQRLTTLGKTFGALKLQVEKNDENAADEEEKKHREELEKSLAEEERAKFLSEVMNGEEIMAYSCASALSTMIVTLLYDSICGLDFNQLFIPYATVESHLRALFFDFWDDLKERDPEAEKDRPEKVVVDALVSRWFEASLDLANIVHGKLKEYMEKIVGKMQSAYDSRAVKTANSQKDDDEEPELVGDDENTDMKKAENESANAEAPQSDSPVPVVKDAVQEEAPANEKRLFPALEFDEQAPSSHAFISKAPSSSRLFMRAVRAEHTSLMKNLPDGIYVKAYENRLDLLSAVIIGPKGTPFEDVPFFFDVHLPAIYPAEPPLVHYWAFSQEQLNPNLYQTGKVCTSLLGTWNGKGVEQWNAGSNLLQVFLSIQGLILVPEPYYNEAGYEARKNISVSFERSRRYNEMALINSLDYFYRIKRNPPKGFEKLIEEHCKRVLPGIKSRISAWESGAAEPSFPLAPISEGCKLSLRKTTVILGTIVDEHDVTEMKTTLGPSASK